MKKLDKLQGNIQLTLEKIKGITRHIRNVEDNCLFLGSKLIERGDIHLGRKLIANGFIHDSSKFHGIEFEFMAPGIPTEEETAKLKLKLAIHHHNSTNPHHPEYWSQGIKSMPELYLAECVCDWKSRSEEFGTSLRDWIDDHATKRYLFSKDDVVYKKITEFVNLLCSTPFENLSK